MSSIQQRISALDAVRAFAMLIVVMFHATLSFVPNMPPGTWPIVDIEPSATLGLFFFWARMFALQLFFVAAGFVAHAQLQRKGLQGFWLDRGKRIFLPLVAGWLILFPMLAAVFAWGLRITFADGPADQVPMRPLRAKSEPGYFPFAHLWFLYYLLLLFALLQLGRAAVLRLDGRGRIRTATDAAMRRLVASHWMAVLLALPVAIALALRPQWIFWQGLQSPDHSIIPAVDAVAGFGVAMVFGWLLARQDQLLEQMGRRWFGYTVGGVVTTALALSIAGFPGQFTPAPDTLAKPAFALCFTFGTWCWVFAIYGAAIRFFSKENGTIRYVADSSFFVYLVHLPIVLALEVAFGRLPWPWSIKYLLIVGITLLVSFAIYHYLVRPTWVGQWLNGRRYPRKSAQPPVALAG